MTGSQNLLTQDRGFAVLVVSISVVWVVLAALFIFWG
jgi:hypothetical protein